MTYPTITGLTTPPNRTDSRADFNSNMAQTFVDIDAMATSANDWAAYFNPLAVTMQSNADTAAAAFAALGAVAWVSGTTYAVGDVVYSPINSLSYRRLTAGAGTTDPANDPTNWRGVSRDLAQVVTDISGTYTVGHDDRGGILRATAATAVTLPSAGIGNGFTFSIDAQAAGGDVTLTPDGSETIDGAGSIVVADTSYSSLISDGANWISLSPASLATSDVLPSAGYQKTKVHYHEWDDLFATTSTTFVDVTGSSFTFTPSSASSKLIITASPNLDHRNLFTGLFNVVVSGTPILQGGTGTGHVATFGVRNGTSSTSFTPKAYSKTGQVQLASGASVTIKLMARTTGDTACVNRSQFNDANQSLGVSTFSVMEVF